MASIFVLLEAFNRKEAAALGFFPCATAPFSFFAVADKMGTARTFIPFPIMRMCGGFSNRTSSMRRLQISDTRAAVSYNTHNP